MMKIGAGVKALGRKFCAVRQLSAIHRFFSAGYRVNHYGRVFSARSHSAPRFLLRRQKICHTFRNARLNMCRDTAGNSVGLFTSNEPMLAASFAWRFTRATRDCFFAFLALRARLFSHLSWMVLLQM